jgi:hypothetical protein
MCTQSQRCYAKFVVVVYIFGNFLIFSRSLIDIESPTAYRSPTSTLTSLKLHSLLPLSLTMVHGDMYRALGDACFHHLVYTSSFADSS